MGDVAGQFHADAAEGSGHEGAANPAPVIVVTGTKRESAVLSGDDGFAGLVLVASGGAPNQLARDLLDIAPGAAGIISFGMAGALDRSIKLGDWVIGRRLIGAFPATCDPRWVAALSARLPRARVGAMLADGRLMSDPTVKATLAGNSAALAVDMESHVAGWVARELGLPFAILRCISDTAEVILPPAVSVAMKPGGGLAVGSILGSMAHQPGQIGSVLSVGIGFARAYGSLRAGVAQIGSRLAFDLRRVE